MSTPNEGLLVKYTAAELVSEILEVRRTVQRGDESAGEFALTRTASLWIGERTRDEGTKAYLSALITVTLYSGHASELYNQAWQELVDRLAEIEDGE